MRRPLRAVRNPDMKILVCCMGNICRSPTAEGVLRARVEAAGLAHRIDIESAGTHAHHVGSKADPRAMAAAHARGVDLSGIRARRVGVEDFIRFDRIYAMDRDNLRNLERKCPEDLQYKLALFMQHAERHAEDEVPDPYYGGPAGFERVLDLIEDASDGLVRELQQRFAAGS
ncbi:MAG: low molecular weight phosphotyrosine protein phosphatase [Gammaproteobacteria bacterium]|jgi:protein-tyrosine phosphatase|nr:low molecular weight phosphotyrosine protein phosphatase [Gammaproteobacteria bacterium]MBU0773127.1 low molecular weight phosphotyrosine protein phosphatase [Gammaproteobacteria bacterium]MBU0855765.1 low molecular weight phosphotyrosine protein phosphatase [Gammaproteobacteria bacterium]MBU1846966.1 low molecular weight phosphotyrosine protein phosphatase [Gammaproteobacteria bacterium]